MVAGGGAAGFFAAIACAEANPASTKTTDETNATLVEFFTVTVLLWERESGRANPVRIPGDGAPVTSLNCKPRAILDLELQFRIAT